MIRSISLLAQLRSIDAPEADALLSASGIQNDDRTVRNLNHLAGEGVGQDR